MTANITRTATAEIAGTRTRTKAIPIITAAGSAGGPEGIGGSIVATPGLGRPDGRLGALKPAGVGSGRCRR
jgi:hypothetical protein